MQERKSKKQSTKVNNDKRIKEKSKTAKKRAQNIKKERAKDENRVKLFVTKKPLDYGLLAIVLILLTVGLIMLFSASSPYSLRTEGYSYFYFSKQVMFAGIGLVLMFIISKIDYRIFNSKIAWLAYIGGLGLMSLVLVPRDRCKKK